MDHFFFPPPNSFSKNPGSFFFFPSFESFLSFVSLSFVSLSFLPNRLSKKPFFFFFFFLFFLSELSSAVAVELVFAFAVEFDEPTAAVGAVSELAVSEAVLVALAVSVSVADDVDEVAADADDVSEDVAVALAEADADEDADGVDELALVLLELTASEVVVCAGGAKTVMASRPITINGITVFILPNKPLPTALSYECQCMTGKEMIGRDCVDCQTESANHRPRLDYIY